MDMALFKSVMSRYTTGVTVLTFWAQQTAAGMTANAFMSVSLDPPLVLISIRCSSRFINHVQLGTRFGINVLADNQQGLSSHFGGRAVDGIHLPFSFHENVPLLDGSLAHMVVKVVDTHPAGDHVLYISEVDYLRLGEQRKPLVYFSGLYPPITAPTPVLSWSGSNDCW
jgi:flavin reductase (DIM6/NTAB) family NADH-FMN oxidoreductase RutF